MDGYQFFCRDEYKNQNPDDPLILPDVVIAVDFCEQGSDERFSYYDEGIILIIL